MFDGLGRCKEAEKIDKEVSMFNQDLNLGALDRAMSGYFQESDFCPMAYTMEKVKEELRENKREEYGAYYCSYFNFIDLYRIKARMDEMNNEQSLLLLCTLFAEKGEWRGEEEEKEQMELFRETLMQQTRLEDIYTQYSRNQYLVLLSGVKMESKNPLAARLRSHWEKAGGRARVEFSADTVKGN